MPAHRRNIALGVLLSTAMAIPMFGTPASAAPTYPTKTRKYSATRDFWSSDLKRCFRTVVGGAVTFKIAPGNRAGSYRNYTNVKLKKPFMSIAVFKKRVRKNTCNVGTRAKVNSLSMTQRWYEHRCTMGVDIGVGAPWSIGATPTVECGNEETANRETGYDATSSYFRQNNSGSPVRFKGVTLYANAGRKGKSLCLSTKPVFTAYIAANSDTWSQTMTICVKP